MSNVTNLSFTISEAVDRYEQCYPKALQALRDLSAETVKVILRTFKYRKQEIPKMRIDLTTCNGYLKQMAEAQVAIRKAKNSCPSERTPLADYKHQEEFGVNIKYLQESENCAIELRAKLTLLDMRIFQLMSRFIGRVRVVCAHADLSKPVDSSLYFWTSRKEEMLGREGKGENIFPFFRSYKPAVDFRDLEPQNGQVQRIRAKDELGALTTLNEKLTGLTQESLFTDSNSIEVIACSAQKKGGGLPDKIENMIELYRHYPKVLHDLIHLQIADDEWFLQGQEHPLIGVDKRKILHAQFNRFLKYEASFAAVSFMQEQLEITIQSMPSKKTPQDVRDRQECFGYDFEYIAHAEDTLFFMKEIFERALFQVSSVKECFSRVMPEARKGLSLLVYMFVKDDPELRQKVAGKPFMEWATLFLEKGKRKPMNDEQKSEPPKQLNPKKTYEALEKLNEKLIKLHEEALYEKFETIKLSFFSPHSIN